MDINQLIKNRKKATYKAIVFRNILIFTAVLLFMFGAYTFYTYEEERQLHAQNEAQNTVQRIVSQNDERFENLRQYYVTMADNDSIKWMLEKDVKYSDYSHYKKAYEDMGSQGIFADSIESFTFTNFQTGWVLSNKGLFQTYEVCNRDILFEMYERKTKIQEKNYWSYDSGVEIDTKVDRDYRVTVETDGLNFVMHLPFSSYNTYALFIANINMETWRTWIQEGISEHEKVLVTDANGECIYATEPEFTVEDIAAWENQQMQGSIRKKGTTYVVSKKTSDVLGWNYYVFYDVSGGHAGLELPLVLWGVLIVIVMAGFWFVGHMIYLPIDSLIKNVSGVDGKSGKIEGNELDYLAGSYHSLKKDKQALEGLLTQQQDKLQELFELRLIHGEVKNEEWDEYLEGFHLRSWKYFATAVVILNLKDDEVQSMVNEDVICLKILQEMPENVKNKAWMPPIYNASAIFAIFAEDDEEQLLIKIREFYKQMQECAKKICDYQIMMGVSATHTDYHHIRAAYRESINALTINNEMIISNENEQENDNLHSQTQDCKFYLASSTVLGNDYNHTYENDIQTAVKAVDKQQCYHVTDAFYHFLTTAQCSGEALHVYILRYVNTILVTAINAGINLSEIYPDGIKSIYRELLEVTEPDRVRRYIKWRFIDPVIEKRTQILESRPSSILEDIENLIATRNGNITLTECADMLGVHHTYIWKVLKMERGKAFSDYVEEYKLIEAKRLLLESNLTVAEIAEKLNYTNAQNFIRFFSKATGVTPGKFRKLY